MSNSENIQEVSHGQFVSYVRRFSRTQSLAFIAACSAKMDKTKAHIAEVFDSQGRKFFISQWSLAYISYMLILFGNEYRKAVVNEGELGLLCHWHTNLQYISPESDKAFIAIVRLSQEQIVYQDQGTYHFARSYFMLTTITQKAYLLEKLDVLNVFEEKFGISVEDYFSIAWVIYLFSLEHPVFNKADLLNTQVSHLKSIMTEEKIDKFIAITSSTIEAIKKEHVDINGKIIEEYEKYWFNLATRYPIARLDVEAQCFCSFDYIVLNLRAMFNKLVEGPYWALRDFYLSFENKKEQKAFVDMWSYVYEEYIGWILKQFYGDDCVYRIDDLLDEKNDGSIADWLVINKSEIIIFECKSSLLPLSAKISMSNKVLKKWALYNLGKAFRQLQAVENYLNNKIIDLKQDISKKRIVKVVVSYQNLYMCSVWKQQVMKYLEKNTDAKIDYSNTHILDILDLELFERVKDKSSFSEVFDLYEKNPSGGFRNICVDIVGEKLSSSLLSQIENKFFDKQIRL